MDGFYEMSPEWTNGLVSVGELTPVEAPEKSFDPADLLVIQVRSGELEAFDQLMILTEKLVLSVAWRILRDREQARDAAQETFLRVFRSLDRFRLGESFQAWVCQITVNVCRDLVRTRVPLPLDLEDVDTLPHDLGHSGSKLGAEETLLLFERRVMVQKALGALPPGERTALVLRDIEGFSTEDVARVLGVRPVTVRTQICSARSKVRAYCDQLLQRTPGGSQ